MKSISCDSCSVPTFTCKLCSPAMTSKSGSLAHWAIQINRFRFIGWFATCLWIKTINLKFITCWKNLFRVNSSSPAKMLAVSRQTDNEREFILGSFFSRVITILRIPRALLILHITNIKLLTFKNLFNFIFNSDP